MKERSSSRAMALAKQASHECACLHSRKLSRMITRDYDLALKPFHLKITQFTVLAAIVAARGNLSLTDLSVHLGMDRSTFSRNLGPLIKRGLVRYKDDLVGRSRGVDITQQGLSLFEASAITWAKAQADLRLKFQSAESSSFLNELGEVAKALHS